MKSFNLSISIKQIAFLVFFFGCLSLSFAQQEREASSMATDPDEKIKVEIFPNPTTDFLNINLDKLDLQKPKFEFRSIIGTKMQVTVENNGIKKYKVDVHSFPRGYYLLLVRDDRSKFQQTIRFSKK